MMIDSGRSEAQRTSIRPTSAGLVGAPTRSFRSSRNAHLAQSLPRWWPASLPQLLQWKSYEIPAQGPQTGDPPALGGPGRSRFWSQDGQTPVV